MKVRANARARRICIQNPVLYPVLATVSACITIQRFVRLQRLSLTTTPTSSESRPSEYDSRQTLVARFIRSYEMQEGRLLDELSTTERSRVFVEFCTVCIQRAWRELRRYVCEVHLRYGVYRDAALTIWWAIKHCPHVGQCSKREYAAKRLQTFWRRHQDRQVFLTLKDYITSAAERVSNSAAALQFLRQLDIVEAGRLESLAADFVVRFRLGAPAEAPWPPRLYWKVFVRSQHLCDVLATAPRCYALERETGVVDQRLWYHRVTNAPWRLLDTRVADSIVSESANVPRPVISKDEAERRRRAKRLRWLREARGTALLESLGVPTLSGTDGEESGEEQDLLNWCDALDFDRYADDWLSCGTITKTREPQESTVYAFGIPGHRVGQPLLYSVDAHDTRSITVGSHTTSSGTHSSSAFII
ncbi:hypothetical protein GMRT_12551 [Giardia muris]|uniref:Uncharacterized protein n=1 Tax=Giardia muris TaxID=5742 RepID=A0A4Z1T783_GIAMU|nr:hypothetical protein GMRT_12551 [Giardia muris]|eukprot:TNJ28419.1 hypothetical protein GMRT_12551 [Giardia muris]